MPKGIAGRGIAGRTGIGRRQLANRYGLFDYPAPYLFPQGSYTFIVPVAGKWQIVLWGGGANAIGATSSGGSGALYIAIRDLRIGQSLSLAVAASQGSSTLTLPSGEVLTAGGTSTVAAGTATANTLADIAINGNAGTSSSSAAGAAAPSSGNFTGGAGGIAGSPGICPGGGGGVSGSAIGAGGTGLIILARSRD